MGGGNPPKPGEISLAHQGILFLDELPEFGRHSIECLREPLESGGITLARAGISIHFPSRFQLVAAMNPCPCGNVGNKKKSCTCTPLQIQQYQGRLSGPFLDRMDLHVFVAPVDNHVMLALEEKNAPQEESSVVVRERVVCVRQRQLERQGVLNAALSQKMLQAVCALGKKEMRFLESYLQKEGLSHRGFIRLLRVARTIADMSEEKVVTRTHLLEATTYRREGLER